VLASVSTSLRQDTQDAQTAQTALAGAVQSAARITDTAIGDAGRGALRQLMIASPSIDGWHRVTGADTCARCAELTGVLLAPDAPLDRHPGCSCLQEPVVNGRHAYQRASPTIVRP
jgi:hypothetical protein